MRTTTIRDAYPGTSTPRKNVFMMRKKPYMNDNIDTVAPTYDQTFNGIDVKETIPSIASLYSCK